MFSGNKAVINYHFMPSDSSNLINQGQNALNAWNSALVRDKGVSTTPQVGLQLSNDSTSPVIIYSTSNNPDNIYIEPGVPGGEAITSFSNSNQNFGSAGIVINDSNNTPGVIYNAMLQEIGHSLGLNHNTSQGSVMWPSTNSCFQGSQLPPSADTYYLEHTYDPNYALYTASKSGLSTDCTVGSFKYNSNTQVTNYWGNQIADQTLETDSVRKTSGACVQGTRRPNAARAKRSYYLALPTVEKNNQHQALIARSPSKIFEWAGISRVSGYTGRVMLHLDDHSQSSTMSLSSLYVSSTLVADVTVGPVVRYLPNGPTRFALRSVRINGLLRHQMSPSFSQKAGDVIYVGDTEGANGEPFFDDRPLIEGDRAVLFLQQARQFSGVPEGSAYRFTKRFISKAAIGNDGRLKLINPTPSRANQEIHGAIGKHLVDILHEKGQERELSEQRFLKAALAEHGITSQSDESHYEALLNGNSRSVTKWATSWSLARPSSYFERFFNRTL